MLRLYSTSVHYYVTLYDAESIEPIADIIMLLYPDAGEGNNKLKIDLVKQRREPVGTVEFLFEKEVGGFEEVCRTVIDIETSRPM
mgnify:CR=1 FL=1